MSRETTPSSRRQFLGRVASAAISVTGATTAGWMLVGRAEAGTPAYLRPPGALPEPEHLARCIRCGRCADACPNRCIVPFTRRSGKDLAMAPGQGQRGAPAIFPRRQACMLCNGAPGEELLCGVACPTGALQRIAKNTASIQKNVKMGTAEIDTRLCYSFNGASCGVCVRACPLEGKALRAGLWEKPLLDPSACVGCGLCERSCIRYPQAIRVRPSNYQQANDADAREGRNTVVFRQFPREMRFAERRTS